SLAVHVLRPQFGVVLLGVLVPAGPGVLRALVTTSATPGLPGVLSSVQAQLTLPDGGLEPVGGDVEAEISRQVPCRGTVGTGHVLVEARMVERDPAEVVVSNPAADGGGQGMPVDDNVL